MNRRVQRLQTPPATVVHTGGAENLAAAAATQNCQTVVVDSTAQPRRRRGLPTQEVRHVEAGDVGASSAVRRVPRAIRPLHARITDRPLRPDEIPARDAKVRSGRWWLDSGTIAHFRGRPRILSYARVWAASAFASIYTDQQKRYNNSRSTDSADPRIVVVLNATEQAKHSPRILL